MSKVDQLINFIRNLTPEQAEKIISEFPTPFHIYDEKGIRENARKTASLLFLNIGSGQS